MWLVICIDYYPLFLNSEMADQCSEEIWPSAVFHKFINYSFNMIKYLRSKLLHYCIKIFV